MLNCVMAVSFHADVYRASLSGIAAISRRNLDIVEKLNARSATALSRLGRCVSPWLHGRASLSNDDDLGGWADTMELSPWLIL